jgi:hypothetical protein
MRKFGFWDLALSCVEILPRVQHMLQCTQKRTDLQPLKVNAIYFAHNCTTGRLAVDVIACLFACVCVCCVYYPPEDGGMGNNNA